MACSASVLLAVLCLCAAVHALPELVPAGSSVLWEAKEVEFNWSSEKSKNKALSDGRYIPANVCPAGVKYHNGKLFVTVPRWREGVPSTLNVVKPDGRLASFPDTASQNFTAGGFHYVQSMEIDSKGRMWVIDTGRRHIFDEHPIPYTPKIHIIDLATEKIVQHYTFPEDVASPATSFLNDIAVDDTRDIAYISDASGDGAIVVFNLAKNTSWRVHHDSMKAQPSAAYVLDGINMGDFPIPIDGITLSADKQTVFYCPLLGEHLYSVPAEELRAHLAFNVVDHGVKPPSDGLAFSDNGKLYFGSLPENTVYEYDPSTKDVRSAKPIYTSASAMSWPDTFAFDNKGNLLVLSNRLHKFVTKNVDWKGDANFRVVSIPINGNSYTHGKAAAPAAPTAHAAPNHSFVVSDALQAFFPALFRHKNHSLMCCSPKLRDALADFVQETVQATKTAVSFCPKNLAHCAHAFSDYLSHTYETDPLKSAVLICIFASLLVYVLGVLTKDLSQVDRLWSILPPLYVLHFLSYAPDDPRLQVMATLATLWGIRLTYNFWRKGGYESGGEDYRWEYVRKDMFSPWMMAIFEFVFIAFVQNFLLLAIALPAYVAYEHQTPLGVADLVATLAFSLALILETAADEQQWAFQESKHGRQPRQPALKADYQRGFLTSGLFALSRHPNFFGEQALWVAFYVFAISSSHTFCLPAAAGALFLISLFQGSTWLTEKISLGKYPAYAEYQKTTSRLWPWFPLEGEQEHDE